MAEIPGVGLTYLASHDSSMRQLHDAVDYFELSPDVLCVESLSPPRRLTLHPDRLGTALDVLAARPLVVHGLGLSIAGPDGYEESYLSMLEQFAGHRTFEWHSEHLAFLSARDSSGAELHAGIPLPVPFTAAAVEMLVPRVLEVSSRFDVPFLLENTAHYLPGLLCDDGWDEARLLNELSARTGCGLLLDLYNLWCNCQNHDIDPFELLGRLDLERVIEIHVAGGGTHEGFVVDIHSDEIPAPVWSLLRWVVPRAPALRGVTYELLDDALPLVGIAAVRRQLAELRELLSAHARGSSCH